MDSLVSLALNLCRGETETVLLERVGTACAAVSIFNFSVCSLGRLLNMHVMDIIGNMNITRH